MEVDIVVRLQGIRSSMSVYLLNENVLIHNKNREILDYNQYVRLWKKDAYVNLKPISLKYTVSYSSLYDKNNNNLFNLT